MANLFSVERKPFLALFRRSPAVWHNCNANKRLNRRLAFNSFCKIRAVWFARSPFLKDHLVNCLPFRFHALDRALWRDIHLYNLILKDNNGRFFNPLTPGAFCKKRIFWTFWRFSGWISAKLALIWLKMNLQHDSLPFLPLASRFITFWLAHALKSKF